jgi:prepilin-type processing-associated H-X9-DG protein
MLFDFTAAWIAVLVSLLLPALGRVREQAKAVRCGNNLKQVHFAFQRYAEKHRGYYPAPWAGLGSTTPNNWITQWPYVMMTYFQSNPRIELGSDFNPFGTRDYNAPDWGNYAEKLSNPNNAPVAFCPNMLETGLREINSNWFSFQLMNYSYAINTGGFNPFIPPVNGARVFDTNPNLWGNAKPSRMKRTSERPYLFDVVGEGAEAYGRNGDPSKAAPWADYTNLTRWSTRPHLRKMDEPRRADANNVPNDAGRSNFLFYDGHVELLAPRSIKPFQMNTLLQ